jgi:hypothetical protein
MKTNRRPPIFILCALASVIFFPRVPAFSKVEEAPGQTKADMEAYIALLRQDYELVKVDLINDALALTADEAAVFWPIYRTYEEERRRLVDLRFEVIYDFAQTIDAMTDEIAADLVGRSFAIERGRTDLKEKTFVVLSEKLGTRMAARFIQAEGQLEALVNFRLASEIPLID